MRRIIGGLCAAAALLVTGCSTADPGYMGVVRNGGPYDNHQIRTGASGIQCPGTGNVWNGWGSSIHWIPDSTAQRTFKFDNEGHPDARPRTALTKDGYHLSLTGTFYFKTAFDCTQQGRALAEAFDTQFAGRPIKPWEDWSGWLSLDVLPVIDGAVRRLSAYTCEELYSSCGLVQRTGRNGATQTVPITTIQTAIAGDLKTALAQTFGHPYFTDVKLQLNRPTPDPVVKNSIDQAQAAFGQVTQAQARKQAASTDLRTNRIKQKGYRTCRACALQDDYKAFGQNLPEGVQSVTFGGTPVTNVGP